MKIHATSHVEQAAGFPYYEKHHYFKQLRAAATAGETRGEVYKIMLVRLPKDQFNP